MKRVAFILCLGLAVSGLRAGDHGQIVVYQPQWNFIGEIEIHPTRAWVPLWGGYGYAVFAPEMMATNSGDPGIRFETMNRNAAYFERMKLDIQEDIASGMAIVTLDCSQIKDELIKSVPYQGELKDLFDGIGASLVHTYEAGDARIKKVEMKVIGHPWQKDFAKLYEQGKLGKEWQPYVKFNR